MADKVVQVMNEVRLFQNTIAKFKAMQVDPTEFACLKGIVLFKSGMCEDDLSSGEIPEIIFLCTALMQWKMPKMQPWRQTVRALGLSDSSCPS